jgi:cation/acetate symporter
VVPTEWHIPLTSTGPDDHPGYRTASTVLALCLGTMGLPHVLVRYYTNPDGVGARRTTVTVLALLGTFYLLPPIYAVLGRVSLPELPDGARTDSIVLRLPTSMMEGLGGQLLTAMLAGGAFAAFLSTASGLAMSVTGVLDQELLRPRLSRLTGGDSSAIRGFRYAAVIAVVLPYVISRVSEPLGLATTVGLAFAVAAATFAPLIILGVWWRRLSTTGAMAGLVVGGASAVGAIGTTMAVGDLTGWTGALLANPAMWATPLALVVAVTVSLATPSRIPSSTRRTMLRLHTPERVGLTRGRAREPS